MSAGLSSAFLAEPPPPPSFFLLSFLAGAWPLVATAGAPSAAEEAEVEAAFCCGAAELEAASDCAAAEVEAGGAADWEAEVDGAAPFDGFACLLCLLAFTCKTM